MVVKQDAHHDRAAKIQLIQAATAAATGQGVKELQNTTQRDARKRDGQYTQLTDNQILQSCCVCKFSELKNVEKAQTISLQSQSKTLDMYWMGTDLP